MPQNPVAARRKSLLAKLRQQQVPGQLVTNETNVKYLTGFTGDSSYLIITPKKTVLLSDSRYTTQLEEECPDLEVVIRPHSQKMVEAVAKIVNSLSLKALGFEASSVTVENHESWKTALKTTELVRTSSLVEDLRMVKDATEIAEIRHAVRLAERGFETLRAGLRKELTELEVAHDLEHAMRRFGSPGAAFPPIIAAGARAALPHAHPTTALACATDHLLVDWGANSPGGYKSDLTRVLITGKLSAKLEKQYRVVLEAQRQGIAAIRPGVHGKEVDAIARKVIEDAGFGKFFGHSLGHGIGLNIHEGPRLAALSETVLEPGMIVTVEPGVYLPGTSGVRIEDDVLVTADGHEVLTSVPKELEQAVVRL